MVLITIITVVLNKAIEIEKTIRSVLNQTYGKIDYIIIDGGSTDGTLSVIEKYNGRIRYISEPDKGLYDAMNKGWQMAETNSYIIFLGAGDEIISLPQNLSQNYSQVYYGHVYIGTQLFKSTHNSIKLRLANTLHHQALLIPKKVNEGAPFNLRFKLYADFDFTQRLLKRKVRFHYCRELKGYALPGGISAKRSDREMKSIVQKNFGSLMSIIAFCYYKLQKLKGLFQ